MVGTIRERILAGGLALAILGGSVACKQSGSYNSSSGQTVEQSQAVAPGYIDPVLKWYDRGDGKIPYLQDKRTGKVYPLDKDLGPLYNFYSEGEKGTFDSLASRLRSEGKELQNPLDAVDKRNAYKEGTFQINYQTNNLGERIPTLYDNFGHQIPLKNDLMTTYLTAFGNLNEWRKTFQEVQARAHSEEFKRDAQAQKNRFYPVAGN